MSPRDIKPEDLMPRTQTNTDIVNIHTEVQREVQSIGMITTIEYTSLILLIIMTICMIINRQRNGKFNKIILAVCVFLGIVFIGTIFLRTIISL